MSLIELLSSIFSYIFITIIYLFIFSIIRLIYKDIRLMSRETAEPLPPPVKPRELEVAFSEIEDEDDYGEYFGVLRVVYTRQQIGKLSDEYILDKDVVVIGRASRRGQSDIQIDDAFLSSEHLKLTFDGTYWFAQDLNSRNGTFVNGESIETCKLKNGDEISVGSVIFELEV